MSAARGPRRRLSALPGWLLAPILVVLTAAATVQQSAPYRRGETIEITGTVSDAAGAPVEDLTVVLLAAHRGFTLRGFRRVEEGLVRVPTRTDAQGRFRLEWRWDPYYDLFRIRAEGVPTASTTAGGRGRRVVLSEIDLARRIEEGSPVVVALAVAGGGSPRNERGGRAVAADPRPSAAATVPTTAHSDDERRVFEEMGKPDRVDRLEMPGGDETAWWYFERGKSFHFRGGRLDQVMEFDPVQGR